VDLSAKPPPRGPMTCGPGGTKPGGEAADAPPASPLSPAQAASPPMAEWLLTQPRKAGPRWAKRRDCASGWLPSGTTSGRGGDPLPTAYACPRPITVSAYSHTCCAEPAGRPAHKGPPDTAPNGTGPGREPTFPTKPAARCPTSSGDVPMPQSTSACSARPEGLCPACHVTLSSVPATSAVRRDTGLPRPPRAHDGGGGR